MARSPVQCRTWLYPTSTAGCDARTAVCRCKTLQYAVLSLLQEYRLARSAKAHAKRNVLSRADKTDYMTIIEEQISPCDYGGRCIQIFFYSTGLHGPVCYPDRVQRPRDALRHHAQHAVSRRRVRQQTSTHVLENRKAACHVEQ